MDYFYSYRTRPEVYNAVGHFAETFLPAAEDFRHSRKSLREESFLTTSNLQLSLRRNSFSRTREKVAKKGFRTAKEICEGTIASFGRGKLGPSATNVRARLENFRNKYPTTSPNLFLLRSKSFQSS